MEPSELTVAQAEELEFVTCCKDFHYFRQFLKTSDEWMGAIRPFPDYPHLLQFADDWVKHDEIIVAKAGRTMISLSAIALAFWEVFRAGQKVEGMPPICKIGYMAHIESLAMYQIGRFLTYYENLPAFLRNRNKIKSCTKLSVAVEKGGMIEGYAASSIGQHGSTFTHFIFDEVCKHPDAQEANRAFGPRARKKIYISTPWGTDSGSGKFFKDMWQGLIPGTEDMHRLDFCKPDLHPEHNPEWMKKATVGMSEQEIAQEFMGQMEIYYGKSVFSNFNRKGHIKDNLKFIDTKPIYIGWDLGYHHPAVVFMQRNTSDQWLVLYEFLKKERDDIPTFEAFALRAKELAIGLWPRRSHLEIHCVPHDANSRADSRTYQEIVEKVWKPVDGSYCKVYFGAKDVGTRHKEGPRLMEVRRVLSLRGDNQYGLLVSSKCQNLIEGFSGGYQYAEDKDYEVPLKNLYSHLQDCVQVVVTAYKKMVDPEEEARKKAAQKPHRYSKYRIGR